MTSELSTKKVMRILKKYAVGDEMLTAVIKKIKKPVSKRFLKQPIEVCGGCGFFKLECQCPYENIEV